MKKNRKVSIIITNYNGGQVFVDCIKSVRQISYPNFEVIVVDDGSKDNSISRVSEEKGNLDIKIFINKKNLGFAGANNRGVRHANGDYILLLNNDTTVDKDLLTKLVERFEEDKTIGAAQAKIHMMANPKYLDNAGAFLTRTGFLAHWGFGKKDSKEYLVEREIFSAKGACLFIRREVIDKVGLFDDDFVSYIEESDFCWRVWLAGWRIIFFPKTYIYHMVGYTFSKQFNPVKVNYNSFKNRILSLYKNLNTLNLFLILLPHLIIVCGLGVYYLIKLQFDKFGMVSKALWWNIINLPRSIEKRRKVQALRVKKDNELFPIIMQKTSASEMYAHFKKVEKNF